MNPERPGDRAGTEAWLTELRARFLSVARRRVTPDAAEDVVQEALRIVVEQNIARPGALATAGEAGLAFGFRVLRNVIGNHYQKLGTERRRRDPAPPGVEFADPAPEPLLALERAEALAAVRAGLDAMAATDERCARYLARLAAGYLPREVAKEERMDEALFYRRVYRCRRKLRALLEQRGFFA